MPSKLPSVGTRFRALSFVEPALIGLVVALLLYQFFASHVEGDQAFLLYAARQVLNGVQLDGPRLVETNPPFIVWFNEIPAGLAQVLHISPVLGLRLITLLITLGGSLWSIWLLRRSRLAAWMGASLTRMTSVVLVASVLCIWPAEFGQREHLLWALLLPYLVALGSRLMDDLAMTERILLGAACGLGICFKPHHVITLVCVELLAAVRVRSLRRIVSPEVLAAFGTCLLYVGAVRLFAPSYLHDIVPQLDDTYWALGEFSLTSMLRYSWRLIAVILLGVAVWMGVRRRLAKPFFSGVLLAASVGASAAYIVQHTGWAHQEFPALSLIALYWFSLILDLGIGHDPGKVVFRVPRLLLGVAIVAAVGLFVVMRTRSLHHASPAGQASLNQQLAAMPEGTTVYVFSVKMNQFTEILDHKLVWGSRYAHLWMLPAIRANEVHTPMGGHPFKALSAERVNQLSTLQRANIAQDLERTKPTYIFVERCTQTEHCDSLYAPFDAVAWYSRDPQFAQLWSHYRLQAHIQKFDRYELASPIR